MKVYEDKNKKVEIIRGYHKKDEPKTEGINIERLMHSHRVVVTYKHCEKDISNSQAPEN